MKQHPEFLLHIIRPRVLEEGQTNLTELQRKRWVKSKFHWNLQDCKVSYQLSHLEHMQNHEYNSLYSQWDETSKDGLQELSYHFPNTTSLVKNRVPSCLSTLPNPGSINPHWSQLG